MVDPGARAMTSVREFFVMEATECLSALDQLVRASDRTRIDAPELLRLARLLRGSAQMAREDAILPAARSLEAAARALASSVLAWHPDVRMRLVATIDDLRVLVGGPGSAVETAARVSAAIARWRSVPGVHLPPARTEPQTTTAAGPQPDFLRFAAAEVSALSLAVAAALPVLAVEPRNREPLKAILRRQRPMLGSARIDTLPAVAGTLRAIDEVTRAVARRDSAIEGDWLAFYRTAMDVLDDLTIPLLEGREPSAAGIAARQRMRQLRDRLLEASGPARPPSADPASPDGPPGLDEFFRHEAQRLLARIERTLRDLGQAPAARQALLRRELIAALEILRDTAVTFGVRNVSASIEAALPALESGDPAPLRTLIPALRSAISTTSTTAEPGGAVPTDDPGERAEDVVPIAALLYRGEAALRRALELQPSLEASVSDPVARETLDEVFDLIRLGLP